MPDIHEGLNAGCWSAGVIASSNDIGLSEREVAALDPDERERRFDAVREKQRTAGAHATHRHARRFAGADRRFLDRRLAARRNARNHPRIAQRVNRRPERRVDDDIPYLLLTPGPLTTSRTVKAAMMQDLCTWDDDYNSLVQHIRAELVSLAGGGAELTSVLMQGSGTFAVEATIGTAVPRDGKLLIVEQRRLRLAHGAKSRGACDRRTSRSPTPRPSRSTSRASSRARRPTRRSRTSPPSTARRRPAS